MISRQFILITISLLIGSFAAQAEVNYHISIKQPEHHLAYVTMQIPAGQEKAIIKLPTWRTGNYKIINQASGVYNFKATAANKALSWKKQTKSSWEISNPSKQAVTIEYELYANELGARSRHIDSTHAYLDATAVLMYSPQLIKSVHKVSLSVPEDWKSYSGMVQLDEHQFIAQDYHQLADSPIETGISELIEFREDGRDYQVVFWGKSSRSNQDIADDLEKMVASSQKIWKGYPYNKYVFMIHATSGATGATEHVNSTVIQRPRSIFSDRKLYLDKFLRTAAHELVHTWNVKAYRPQGLVPYNYQNINYSDLLWKAEGTTSYLQDHILLMSELQTLKEFLQKLSERINKFQRKPGTKVQSVSDSSHEKWIAQSGDFATNFKVNIYDEGYMASWLLDFKMLVDSNLKSGIKALHNELYQQGNHLRTPEKFYITDYNNQTLLNIINKLTGIDYKNWWNKNIFSPAEFNFDKMLDRAGLKFAKQKKADKTLWTGFNHTNKKGLINISKVEKNSPAWKAGLTTGDQLLAINDYKVTAENYNQWLKQFKKDDEIKLTLFRNDQLINKKLTLGLINKKPRKIELVKSPSKKQKAFFKAWLGIEYPKKLK